MNDDINSFITFTEKDGFDKDVRLQSDFYPRNHYGGFSLLDLCCYRGAISCFNYLRTKFNAKFDNDCLRLSFLGGNIDILNELLKDKKPTGPYEIEAAIISHNIDFINMKYDFKVTALNFL
ncbi:hypothetical protein TVAG_350620 [Trichomonas vaginalis G3]|uniref:DUF3447 domain-containing protein n=1 Tax=Trichomonas vaginalis (strain ATCC PRA-98 / G3) TaxID=412133 RepID=A2ESK7_TRIV3|nr:spectrin binding [Trichomonas vaginalis G3]EAY04387.1 hypothetical protein TVAG_350620 [Trichomonas vaginalis G3]KAI5540320.1 spectrin binding [Trichomonas vaginalis G3]|eukprot:XP_001316610.1 hypothetical protein [Trichomonas vaginalis G3]